MWQSAVLSIDATLHRRRRTNPAQMPRRIYHLLEAAGHAHPGKKGWSDDFRSLNYAEALRATTAFAHGLQRVGIHVGDRVAIWLDQGTEAAVAIFATSLAGGVFVPLHPTLKSDQIATMVRDCEARAIITTADRMPALTGATSTLDGPACYVVCRGGPPRVKRPVYAFDDLCQTEIVAMTSAHHRDNQLAAIIYTSGSSGPPKGVMLSDANLLSSAESGAEMFGITNTDRILNIIPFSFVAGLGQLLYSTCQAASLNMMKFVVARRLIERLEHERISMFGTVPLVWSLLAREASLLHKANLNCLRCVNCSGGSPPLEALRALRRFLPNTRILLNYGQTECQRISALSLDELETHPGSAGRSVPGAEVMILREDATFCAPGEVGEIVVRGSRVAIGYWNRPDEDSRTWRSSPAPSKPPDSCARACWTGDFGIMDQDGFLYILGRRDAMIKSSGVRISRSVVEEMLLRCPNVEQAAVIGVHDPFLGQGLKAFVIPRRGRAVQPEALARFCEHNLPVYMVPRSIELVDSFPTLGNGKTDYLELTRQAIQRTPDENN
jgi:acyl-CoA synthetase (AMP-forming)/AMP-acid ligase II